MAEQRTRRAVDLKRFDGGYRIHRKGGGKARVLHHTFEEAEAEAIRLASRNPDATFVSLHEVARAKVISE